MLLHNIVWTPQKIRGKKYDTWSTLLLLLHKVNMSYDLRSSLAADIQHKLEQLLACSDIWQEPIQFPESSRIREPQHTWDYELFFLLCKSLCICINDYTGPDTFLTSIHVNQK